MPRLNPNEEGYDMIGSDVQNQLSVLAKTTQSIVHREQDIMYLHHRLLQDYVVDSL
jgi:hypothetical protein